MNKQNTPQPNEPVQSSKHIWITIIAVVLTAIIVGGGVYAWQRLAMQSMEKSSQQQILSLRDQVNQLQKAQNIQETSEQKQPDQNQPDNQQITDAHESSLKTLCEDNGGKFLGTIQVTNNGYSPVCLLPKGRYCEEFGYNKCVESKGDWQP